MHSRHAEFVGELLQHPLHGSLGSAPTHSVLPLAWRRSRDANSDDGRQARRTAALSAILTRCGTA